MRRWRWRQSEHQVREHEFAARCSAYVISLKYGADTKAADIHTIPQRFETMEAEDIKKELLEIHDSVKAITERMAEVLEKTQYKEPPQSKNRRTREVRGMNERVIVVCDFERRILIDALADRRNDLIAGKKPAEDVNTLLLKVIDAPLKKAIKKSHEERK